RSPLQMQFDLRPGRCGGCAVDVAHLSPAIGVGRAIRWIFWFRCCLPALEDACDGGPVMRHRSTLVILPDNPGESAASWSGDAFRLSPCCKSIVSPAFDR